MEQIPINNDDLSNLARGIKRKNRFCQQNIAKKVKIQRSTEVNPHEFEKDLEVLKTKLNDEAVIQDQKFENCYQKLRSNNKQFDKMCKDESKFNEVDFAGQSIQNVAYSRMEMTKIQIEFEKIKNCLMKDNTEDFADHCSLSKNQSERDWDKILKDVESLGRKLIQNTMEEKFAKEQDKIAQSGIQDDFNQKFNIVKSNLEKAIQFLNRYSINLERALAWSGEDFLNYIDCHPEILKDPNSSIFHSNYHSQIKNMEKFDIEAIFDQIDIKFSPFSDNVNKNILKTQLQKIHAFRTLEFRIVPGAKSALGIEVEQDFGYLNFLKIMKNIGLQEPPISLLDKLTKYPQHLCHLLRNFSLIEEDFTEELFLNQSRKAICDLNLNFSDGIDHDIEILFRAFNENIFDNTLGEKVHENMMQKLTTENSQSLQDFGIYPHDPNIEFDLDFNDHEEIEKFFKTNDYKTPILFDRPQMKLLTSVILEKTDELPPEADLFDIIVFYVELNQGKEFKEALNCSIWKTI